MTGPFSSLARVRTAALGLVCAAATAGAAFPGVALAQPGGPIPCGDVAALKAAIVSANATPTTPTTINLTPGCRYQLTSADNGENGLPVVASPITVNGAGATIAGNGGFRIWDVSAAGNLTLRLVDVTGGRASQGGGILNAGTLRLDGGRLYGNSVDVAGPAGGGGLYNAGTAVIAAGRVDDNSATSSTDVTAGGGIENAGRLTVQTSRIDHNRAVGVGDAGIGGGIDNAYGATLEVDASQITANSASSAGKTATASGGGISNVGTVVVRGGSTSGNAATSPHGTARGAGLANVSTMSLIATTVSGNTATSPGVVGGGIYTASGLAVTASHIDANVVHNTGSAGTGAEGAGIFAVGDIVLTASSITRNRAEGSGPQGAGIFVLGTATVRAVATTVTANQPDNCFPPGSVAGCQG